MKYRLPAEWELQESIVLAWPHNKNDWPGKFAPIPWVYVEMVRAIARTQTVRILVRNQAQIVQVRDMLECAQVNMAKVKLHVFATNRVWTRDSGPITVMDGKSTVALDFKFTAWAKYPNFVHDNKLPEFMASALKRKLVVPKHKGKQVVLEGGAIDSNGAGVLLTTEECLLSNDVQVRNKGFTSEDYEAVFASYFGVTKTVWLSHGIVGDDTHGHVDDISRFVAKNRVVSAIEPNKKDENHAVLVKNKKILERANLEVVELPMPRPLYFENTRLPASYANFLICNSVVLVPIFNDPNDRIALNILAECFKGREVIGIPSVDMVWGFGTIHCASMQIPA